MKAELMNWIIFAFLAAAVLHVFEEYAWPGGFPAFMRRTIPHFAAAVTTPFAVVVNAAFLLLCAIVAVVGPAAPVLGLSVAALLVVNALTHIGSSLRARQYAPGLITGGLLFLPLGIYAFCTALSGGWATPRQALTAGLLGLAYAAVPPLWLGLAFLIRRGRSGASLLMLLLLVIACVAPMPDAVVMIRGNRILAAGRRTDATIPAGARVIDVSGATILPGFINAHVHRGYSEANLKAWAQAGVTTVRDLGAAPWEDAFVRHDALLRDTTNARLVAAGPLVTVPGGYPMVPWGMAGLAVTSPQDAISQTNRLLDAGADIIKIAIDSGGSFGRQIPILSPQEASAIVQTAHSRGARVSAHVLRMTDLARALALA